MDIQYREHSKQNQYTFGWIFIQELYLFTILDNSASPDLIEDEIFEGEDSEEEFDGFDVPSGDEEEFDTIDSGDWKVGTPNKLPKLMEFEDSLTGLRTKELPENPTFLDYHKLFVPDHVYATITMETNR